MKHIMLIAGARPNFMKIAPLHRALLARGAKITLVHTGQHYDPIMSEIFFRELDIPAPSVNLGIGSGDRITQTKKILDGLIPLLKQEKPDVLVVVGDVLSSAASALAAMVADVPLAHVEAGLRSFNMAMPEELNRMISDHHAQWLFVTEPEALKHLKNENLSDRVHVVGNVMIDCLRSAEARADQSDVLARHGLTESGYGVLTLHRPENVDHPETLARAWNVAKRASESVPLFFPVHPRTRSRLDSVEIPSTIRLIEPLGYLDMVALMKHSRFVMTDSGGLQEEASALNVPCLTVRTETERPITITHGTNEMIGFDLQLLDEALRKINAGAWKKQQLPDLWDGHAAERITDILLV